jgi:hypothetical protein
MTGTKADIRKRVIAKRDAASPEWRAMASRDITGQAVRRPGTGRSGPRPIRGR